MPFSPLILSLLLTLPVFAGSIGLPPAGRGGADPLGIGGQAEIHTVDPKIEISRDELDSLPATISTQKLRQWVSAQDSGARVFLFERDMDGLWRVRHFASLEAFRALLEKDSIQVVAVNGAPSILERSVRNLSAGLEELVLTEETDSVLQQAYVASLLAQSGTPNLWLPADTARLQNFASAWQILDENLPAETAALRAALRPLP